MASTSDQRAGALSVGPSFKTLGELLEYRAEVNGDSLALNWVDGEEQGLSLTDAELYARARAIGAHVLDEGRGQHVLLLYPPGVDFILASAGAGSRARSRFPPTPPTGGVLNDRSSGPTWCSACFALGMHGRPVGRREAVRSRVSQLGKAAEPGLVSHRRCAARINRHQPDRVFRTIEERAPDLVHLGVLRSFLRDDEHT